MFLTTPLCSVRAWLSPQFHEKLGTKFSARFFYIILARNKKVLQQVESLAAEKRQVAKPFMWKNAKLIGGCEGGEFQFEGQPVAHSPFLVYFAAGSAWLMPESGDRGAWKNNIQRKLVEIINCDKISMPFCNTLKEQFNLMCSAALDARVAREYANVSPQPKNKHRLNLD